MWAAAILVVSIIFILLLKIWVEKRSNTVPKIKKSRFYLETSLHNALNTIPKVIGLKISLIFSC